LLSAVMPESTVSKTENAAPSEVSAPSDQTEQTTEKTSVPSNPSVPSEPQAKQTSGEQVGEQVGEQTQAPEEWGERHDDLANSGSKGVAELRKRKSGWIPNAWVRDDIGGIALPYGKTDAEVKAENKGRKTGYGLAHIDEGHPDLDWDLADEAIRNGKITEKSGNRIILEHASNDQKHRVVVQIDFDQISQNWLVTVYKKVAESPANPLTTAHDNKGVADNITPENSANNTIPQSAEKSSGGSEKIINKITSSPAGSNTRIMAFTELADGEHTVNGKTFTKSGSAFTLDGKTLNAKEIEKATRTLTEKIKAKPKAEEKPSDQSDQSEKIEDYGEKIGGARKDSLIKYRKLGNQTIAEEDGEKVPAWRKKYFAMQGFNGKWGLFVEDKKHWGGARQITRSDFDSEAEALKHITEAHIANNYMFLYNGEDYSIHKRLKSVNKLVEVKSGFATREEAMKWALKNFDELIAIKTGYGEKDLATAPNYKRTGEPRLNRNVTAEDLGKTFGFRGVEFGLWENQQERQKVLNDAYDALYDLAELLDIPPRALSLNGTLGVGFGSRGKGGSARAHYEPDYVVINLTKPSGAGTFAHEWAHALDHYFKRQASGDDKSMSYLSESPGNPKEKMRKELFEAFKKIRDAITRIERPRNAEEKAELQKRIERRETEFTDKLAKLRDKLANASTEVYSRRKKSNATPEQLRRFDEIAKTLKDQPVKWQGITDKTRLKNHYRYTNDAFEKLNDLYKEITGRTGFDAKYYNVGDVAELSYILVQQQNLQDQHDNKIVLPTDYKRNAKALDSNRSDGYWASDVEMFARAFSSFIEDKLKADNRVSEYLSYGSNNDFYDWTGGAKPFPEGAERTAINHAFQKFFDILETKTDPGTGNTALFSTVGDRKQSIEEVNRKFNNDLDRQIAGTLPKGYIHQLGTPGDILLSTGVPNLPIELSARQLKEKADTAHHPFDINDVRDLPKMLQKPIGVFSYGDKNKAQNIIVEVQKDGKNFIVGLSLNFQHDGLIVNSIRGLYPKDLHEWLTWIQDEKSLYLDKEKIQKLIDQQRRNLADVEYLNLDSINNIIQNFENPSLSAKKNENSSMSPITEEEITDLQNNEDTASEIVNNSVFSLVTDQKLIDKLDSEEEAGDYITLYRSVQIAPDGTLHSPMAGKINGKWGSEIVLGKWEQADEHPDMAILKKTKSGKLKFQFKLDKGNGKSIWAAYNPYLHSSSTMLNDQFSSAYTRPELVTIEVRVPKSELTSNYKAEKAKDHVGMMKWKAGVVQGKLSGKREVMLSRWDKPIRIVPDSEVAQHIKEMLDGKNIAIPANVVTPSLRSELEKLGVKIDYSVKEYNADKEVNSKGAVFSTVGDLQTEQSAADVLSRSNDEDISQMVLTQKATNQTEALKALVRLSGKDITNRETGIKAQINSTQRNKLVSTVALFKSKNNGFSFEDHFAAVANIDKLFENGTMVDDRMDKSGDRNVISIKRFVAPVLLGDDFAEAYITVKETSGNKVYSLELDELKKPSNITGGTLKERYHIPEGYNKLLQKIKKARALLKKSENSSTDSAFSVPDVWTGSAADYDKPSLLYIGTGEGSQVYGWGLYGSESRKVAEWYAENDAYNKGKQKQTLFKGKPFEETFPYTLPAVSVEYFALDMVHDCDGDIDYAINVFNERVKSEDGMTETDKQSAAFYQKCIEFLENNKENIDFKADDLTGRRNLYRQTFFADKDHNLIDWGERVPKDLKDKILAQAEKENIFAVPEDERFDQQDADEVIRKLGNYPNYKGQILYQDLSYILGSPKAASEFLYRAGIDGITYIGGSSGVRNYVAFSDEDIRVDEHIRFSLTSDLGDTSLSPIDYRRSIDPMFDFVMEYTDNGIVNPGKEHEGEYFTGSFISSEFVAYSEKKPQGKNQSDKQYQQYLERREQALDNAEGTPLDEIAAAYVRKFGGDEKEISEQILDMLRDLTKRDLISDRAEAKREVAEHEKEQRKEDKAEYAKMKDAELTNQVNELFESKEPVTVDKRWVHGKSGVSIITTTSGEKLLAFFMPENGNIQEDIPSKAKKHPDNLTFQGKLAKKMVEHFRLIRKIIPSSNGCKLVNYGN